jgi:sugar phosphate permease
MGLSAAITAFLYKTVKSKLSYKSISLIGLGLWAFGFLLLSQSLSMPAIIISIVLYGIGQGMILPTLNLWVSELTNTCMRGRMISYLTTFLFVGQFLPPIIFNPVFSSFSFNGVFLISGLICIIFAILLLISQKIKASNY